MAGVKTLAEAFEFVEAVWAWKNELPEMYPDDIYYGKIPGGHAALTQLQGTPQYRS